MLYLFVRLINNVFVRRNAPWEFLNHTSDSFGAEWNPSSSLRGTGGGRGLLKHFTLIGQRSKVRMKLKHLKVDLT